LIYLSILTFFGLTSDLAPKVRVGIFSMIHEIIFHGNGGYDYDTVYNMPIWLRKFTFNKIQEHFDKKNKANQPNKGDLASEETKAAAVKNRKISPPSYVTKAAKK